MANTYTQIHIHAVIAVKYRRAVISKTWKESLHQYITAIIQHQGHKLLAINAMPDHLHIFFGMRPAQSLSDLMQHIKADSSAWINQQKLVDGRFAWQQGYGAFSYAKSQVPVVIAYIQHQETHHRTKDFAEEYLELLKEMEVEYDPKYLFRRLED